MPIELAFNESHYTLCINFFLLIGDTSTGQLIINEKEKETTVDMNSPEIGDITQKSDISLIVIDSNDTFLWGILVHGFQILWLKIAFNESHYSLCINFFLLIGNTSTSQLILNEEKKETAVDQNSPETGDKTQKSDIPLTVINSNNNYDSNTSLWGILAAFKS